MKPNSWLRIGSTVLVLLAIGTVSQASAKETSHLAFVTEYIHELAANEDARANAEKEFKATSNSSRDIFSAIIHSSTLIQLNLNSQISALKSMHLNPPFDNIIPTIIEWDEHKIDLYQKIIDISTIFLSGPKPGVDYGKLSAEMPKIRALINYSDESLFKITPLIFMTLINQKPDSKNHLSHLIITKKEREKLLDYLTTAFGKKLEQKNQNYTVSSASVLKEYLLKGFKCSDEPWD